MRCTLTLLLTEAIMPWPTTTKGSAGLGRIVLVREQRRALTGLVRWAKEQEIWLSRLIA